MLLFYPTFLGLCRQGEFWDPLPLGGGGKSFVSLWAGGKRGISELFS